MLQTPIKVQIPTMVIEILNNSPLNVSQTQYNVCYCSIFVRSVLIVRWHWDTLHLIAKQPDFY